MDARIDLFSLMLLSVGLAMDAFSVATVTGFSLGTVKISDAIRMSISFGVAHVLMPVIGWIFGSTIVDLVSSYDHWIAFLLLLFVGGRMVIEGLEGDDTVDTNRILDTLSLVMITIAVSIDAFAVGLSFRLESLPILVPSIFMGAGTLLFTFVGLFAGNSTGKSFGRRAQIVGGLVLIVIGARIVVTHLV